MSENTIPQKPPQLKLPGILKKPRRKRVRRFEFTMCENTKQTVVAVTFLVGLFLLIGFTVWCRS